MGWTYYHKDHGRTAADEVRDHLTWESDISSYRALDVAVVKLRTAYAAVEQITKATGERKVWAAVFLLGYAPNDEYNFGYKDMDESMGPCECDCPERILNLLTDPPLNEWAAQWRERCRANLAKRQATRGLVKTGHTYELARSLSMRDGATLSIVTVVKRRGSAWICTSKDSWGLYRLTQEHFQGAKIAA